MLSYNMMNFRMKKNQWNMMMMLALVYWALYKMLKEYLVYVNKVMLQVQKCMVYYLDFFLMLVLLQVYVFTVKFKSKNKNNKYHVNA